MNLPWTNTHTQMFTLSSIATVTKRLGPTEIYVEDFCWLFPGQRHTVHFNLIQSLSLHSYLTEGLGMQTRLYCCSY